jgi:hypothetical protein
VYVQGVFETVNILIREAVRVVHHHAESFAIRLRTGAPAVVARAMALAGLAPRLELDKAVATVGHVEHAAELAVETAVEQAAVVAGPLVLFRTARALVLRRRTVPLVALVVGAVGLTAIAVRRATRGRAAGAA